MKLYKVRLKGGSGLRESFVVANNSDEAYQKVKKYCDEKDLCFRSDRELDSVTLLAEDGDYPICEVHLFL